MKSNHTPQESPAIQHQKEPFFGKNQVQKKPFLSPSTLQTKLTVGQPGDKYEQEADSVADHVVNLLAAPDAAPSVQTKCDSCEEKDQKVQLMEEEESVQMQAEEEEMLQSKVMEGTLQRSGQVKDAFDQERELQMKANGEPTVANGDLESQLASAKGAGTTLPADVQTQMEGAIGADFSGVKIHTGSDSQQMNKQLNAQAFTHGKDVFFNEGKYNPSSKQGQHLLAHELTHVVQQTGEA